LSSRIHDRKIPDCIGLLMNFSEICYIARNNGYFFFRKDGFVCPWDVGYNNLMASPMQFMYEMTSNKTPSSGN